MYRRSLLTYYGLHTEASLLLCNMHRVGVSAIAGLSAFPVVGQQPESSVTSQIALNNSDFTLNPTSDDIGCF